MNETVTVLNQSDADRRLLLKLHHRLLGTPPAAACADVPEHRALALVASLAPMAFAFLYLMVLSVILFR